MSSFLLWLNPFPGSATNFVGHLFSRYPYRELKTQQGCQLHYSELGDLWTVNRKVSFPPSSLTYFHFVEEKCLGTQDSAKDLPTPGLCWTRWWAGHVGGNEPAEEGQRMISNRVDVFEWDASQKKKKKSSDDFLFLYIHFCLFYSSIWV